MNANFTNLTGDNGLWFQMKKETKTVYIQLRT